jgi:hypothetical protein
MDMISQHSGDRGETETERRTAPNSASFEIYEDSAV